MWVRARRARCIIQWHGRRIPIAWLLHQKNNPSCHELKLFRRSTCEASRIVFVCATWMAGSHVLCQMLADSSH